MDDLRERVEAVERAVTDGEGDLTALAEGAATADRVEELAATVDDLREEVTTLAAETQALRGYVGNVRSVNEDVEQRADAAVAAVDSIEARLDALESDRSDQQVDHSHEPHARSEASGGAWSSPGEVEAEDPAEDEPTLTLSDPGAPGDGAESRETEGAGRVPSDDRTHQCPTCGRETAEGSTVERSNAHPGPGRQSTPRAPPERRSDPSGVDDSAHSGRGDLGAFEPESHPDRVRIGEPGDEPATSGSTIGENRRSDEAGTDGGLFARARDLL